MNMCGRMLSSQSPGGRDGDARKRESIRRDSHLCWNAHSFLFNSRENESSSGNIVVERRQMGTAFKNSISGRVDCFFFCLQKITSSEYIMYVTV